MVTPLVAVLEKVRAVVPKVHWTIDGIPGVQLSEEQLDLNWSGHPPFLGNVDDVNYVHQSPHFNAQYCHGSSITSLYYTLYKVYTIHCIGLFWTSTY